MPHTAHDPGTHVRTLRLFWTAYRSTLTKCPDLATLAVQPQLPLTFSNAPQITRDMRSGKVGAARAPRHRLLGARKGTHAPQV